MFFEFWSTYVISVEMFCYNGPKVWQAGLEAYNKNHGGTQVYPLSVYR